MKPLLLVVLASLTFAWLGGLGLAWADGEASFGIRPTRAYEDRPESFAYFSRVLEPGAVVNDEALVTNDGSAPLILKLYAVDAITAINGGTTFATQGQDVTGVARWLSLTTSEVVLAPAEQRLVPFTITVPADAAPGEHVAGLVLEALPSGTGPAGKAGEAQFNLEVIRRVGVAVLIEVPGASEAGLTLTDIGLHEQDEHGATFIVDVENTGTVSVRGEGALVISDLAGAELASVPVTVDTVLPGQTTSVYVRHPIRFADANYQLAGRLSFHAVLGDGQGVAAPLLGADLKIKDGQPAAPKSVEDAAPPAGPLTVTGTASPSTPASRYAAYAAAILAAVLLALAVVVWRRTRWPWLAVACLPVVVGLAVYSVPRLADSSGAPPSSNDAAVVGIAANVNRSSSEAGAELVSETDAAVADAGRPAAIEEAAVPGPDGDAPVAAGPAADADVVVTESDGPAVMEESVAPALAEDAPAADTPADDPPDTDALAGEAPGADPAVVAGDSQRPRGMLAQVVATIAGDTDIVGVSDAPVPADDVPLDENDAAPVADEPALAVAGPEPGDALATWPDIVEYVVQPGDALLRIADAFGTTAVAIIALNDIENGEIIEIGETPSVPVNYAGPHS